MSQQISAHGRTFPTVAAANARIAELSLGNMLNGPSDGRVTEINAILQSMIDISAAALDAEDDFQEIFPSNPTSVKLVALSLSLQARGL